MKINAPYVLQKEVYYREYGDVKGFDTWSEAYDECCSQVDLTEEDFRIKETETGMVWNMPAYKLHKEDCPVCGKAVRHIDLCLTRDCHGIPYRNVCPKCYDRLMAKGYDGEYYTEADECIDYDY